MDNYPLKKVFVFLYSEPDMFASPGSAYRTRTGAASALCTWFLFVATSYSLTILVSSSTWAKIYVFGTYAKRVLTATSA